MYRSLTHTLLILALVITLPSSILAAEPSYIGGWIARVEAKLTKGETSPEALAPEIVDIKKFIVSKKNEAPEEAAEAQLNLAIIYLQVFNDSKSAMQELSAIVRDYPRTKAAAVVAQFQDAIRKSEAAAALQAKLVIGSRFPDFEGKDLNGESFALQDFRGKVVLIDFWATWCGPCIVKMPHTKEAYETYHQQGFEILGISLDDERDLLKSFVKDQGIKWRQYFDGKGFENRLAVQFGITAIPRSYLLDKSGIIIATDPRSKELKKAIAKALAD